MYFLQGFITFSVLILAHKDVGIEVFQTENKGRRVRATRSFEKDQFICEYSGDLITKEEKNKREAAYAQNPNIGSYIVTLPENYGFVDATVDDGRMGRLIQKSQF